MGMPEKFLFEHDFDEETAPGAPSSEGQAAQNANPEPEPEPEPELPAYYEADLARVREEGYRAGHEAGLAAGREQGRAEAETAAQDRVSAAMARAADGLGLLVKDLDATEARREAAALDLAVTLVRKLFPALHRRHGLREAEALIAQTLDRLRQQPRVVIRAAEDMAEPLKERSEAIVARAGFDGKLSLIADDTLADGDVQVEWSDGAAHRDTERLWQEIDAAIARILPEAETAAKPEAETATNAGRAPNGNAPRNNGHTPAGAAPESRTDTQTVASASPAAGSAHAAPSGA